jgi:adenosylcobinamide kinase / adenosylcobinamide-phosphate guanylyltransferase
VDEEMAERIRRHQQERTTSKWHTIEETTNLAAVIRENGQYNVFLVDCLTLWINNLMYEADQSGKRLSEDEVSMICRDVLEACSKSEAATFFVTNEVGMGIVPSDPISRRYRDMVGRCNQIVAQAADEVVLVVCGFPVMVKASSGK